MMKEKLPCCTHFCVFRCLGKVSVQNSDSNILLRFKLFLKNYVTLEGVISYNIVHYQQLCVAGYQVCMLIHILSNDQTCPVDTIGNCQRPFLSDGFRENTLVEMLIFNLYPVPFNPLKYERFSLHQSNLSCWH